MTEDEWWAKFDKNKDDLVAFACRYHPGSPNHDPDPMEISATTPELACRQVREQIAREGPVDVGALMLACRAKSDHRGVATILSGAWFGVPESLDCWGARGFSAAAALLDDPVDELDADDLATRRVDVAP